MYHTTHSAIQLDKYYTPVNVAEKLINTTLDLLSERNINVSEIIEPSAGNGAFSLQLPTCKAYDIEPEHPSIIQQDFFKLPLQHKKDRLFIGNPPFGTHSVLLNKFLRKAFKNGDYVAFICSSLFYKKPFDGFDLIYSESLNIKYSDIKVKTCFNIYIRSQNKYEYKFVKDFTNSERLRSKTRCKVWFDNKGYGLSQNPETIKCDLMICRFGGGVGRYTEDINRWCSIGLVTLKEGVDKNYIKQLIDFGFKEFGFYRQISKHNFDFVLKNIEFQYLQEQKKAS